MSFPTIKTVKCSERYLMLWRVEVNGRPVGPVQYRHAAETLAQWLEESWDDIEKARLL